MQAYNRMAKKIPAVTGLHLYNAQYYVITLGLVSHDPIFGRASPTIMYGETPM
jgi:hypothetical protein